MAIKVSLFTLRAFVRLCVRACGLPSAVSGLLAHAFSTTPSPYTADSSVNTMVSKFNRAAPSLSISASYLGVNARVNAS